MNSEQTALYRRKHERYLLLLVKALVIYYTGSLNLWGTSLLSDKPRGLSVKCTVSWNSVEYDIGRGSEIEWNIIFASSCRSRTLSNTQVILSLPLWLKPIKYWTSFRLNSLPTPLYVFSVTWQQVLLKHCNTCNLVFLCSPSASRIKKKFPYERTWEMQFKGWCSEQKHFAKIMYPSYWKERKNIQRVQYTY